MNKNSLSHSLRNYISLFVFFFYYSSTQAQVPNDWYYAVNAGGTGSDLGRGIDVDLAGNSYVSGTFDLTSTFYGTPDILLTSNGGTDIFLAKYDTAGSVVWAVKAGGTLSDQGTGIDVDNSGNIYITGNFSDTATFYGTVNIQLISNGSNDVFIAKYDPSGNVIWAKKAGGLGADYGTKVKADNFGNSYLCGFFPNDSIIFYGASNIGLTSNGANDIFIAKFDPLGNVIWANHAGSTGNDNANGITIDGTGCSYITGTFLNKAYFYGPVLDSVMSQGGNDVFIARYDPNGDIIWVQSAGSLFTDQANDITIDGADNLYITGNSGNNCIFFGPPTNIVLPSNGLSDVFIASYTPTGNLRWAKSGGGSSSDFGYGIGFNPIMNFVTITGYFQGTATFETDIVISAGSADIFVMDWMTNGSSACIRQAGGTGFDRGWDVAGHTSERYIVGEFAGSALFSNMTPPSITITSNGLSDAFVARWTSACALPIGVKDNVEEPQYNLYPNPSDGVFRFESSSGETYTLSVSDQLGKIIFERKYSGNLIVDLSNYATGIYFLMIKAENTSLTKKLVLTK
jgi:hypothetical protein